MKNKYSDIKFVCGLKSYSIGSI